MYDLVDARLDVAADARAQRYRQDDRTIEPTASKGRQHDDTDGYQPSFGSMPGSGSSRNDDHHRTLA